jgi:hypothetical protein
MTQGFRRALRRCLIASASVSVGAAIFAGGAQAAHFFNPSPIFIPSASPAVPYPSQIPVTGLTGTVSKVTTGLSGLDAAGDDLQVLLVGPGGQTTVLYRGACDDGFDGQALFFDDAAATLLPEGGCPTGIYKPTDRDLSPEPFSSPAPQGQPYGATLSAFNGTNPNGTWSLFAQNTNVGTTGIDGGWSLDIETVTPPATVSKAKKKCKKKKKRPAESAKKKKCKKKKKRR